MSIDYLLHSDGAPQRDYAKQVAADGVITYSYSSENFKWVEPDSSLRWPSATITKRPQSFDPQQESWINKIFGFVDSITGVTFQRVSGQRGEIHLNLVGTGEDAYSPLAFTNGYAQIEGWHDKKQYGGLQDIRSIETAIAGALGITPPNGNMNDPSYSWDQTLMSSNGGGLKSFGATFFYTADDQAALQAVLGPSETEQGGQVVHKSTGRETLMVGSDGVKDIFQLTTKGMLLDKGRDKEGWTNFYNSSYVANLNPTDGDKILIHRSLLDPKTPVSKPSKKLGKLYKKAKVSFRQIFGDTYTTGENVYYNDAGKILIDTNGKEAGLTPEGSPKKPYLYRYNEAGINGQIAAFVDPVGPETAPFQAGWVDFFM